MAALSLSSSTSTHPYKIYVHAVPNSNASKDDQSLESPVIKFKCNIKVSYVPDKPITKFSTRAYIQHHHAWHDFEHPANKVNGHFLSTTIFSTTTIPFELRNLHWKQWVHGKESVTAMSTQGIVTSILEVCQSMISKEEARRSGSKKLFLYVFVKKEVIVPHEEYLAMLKAREQEEVLEKLQDMLRLRARGRNFGQPELDEMTKAIRQAELGNSINEALDLVRRRAMRESTRQAVVRLVPAAEEAIQALEKVTLISNGSNNYAEEKCTVCMEEMPMGSQVTQMPCLHVFHGPCIEKWLKTSHMCPICRHKLRTESSSSSK